MSYSTVQSWQRLQCLQPTNPLFHVTRGLLGRWRAYVNGCIAACSKGMGQRRNGTHRDVPQHPFACLILTPVYSVEAIIHITSPK
jgi:hypothetical protein